MAHRLGAFLRAVDRTSEKSGKVVCLLIFVMMVITAIEVVSRYAFNHPTLWVWPINRQLFGVFILFAGIYTMSKEDHIRVEILYDHFSPRMKRVARYCALASFLCFMVALILQGTRMGWNSFIVREKLTGAFPIPLYPLKMLIPVASFLFLLEGIAVFVRPNKK
ncbi:MAG: TRAP transporter small permease subunit [Deltaproteobacteria bacterium]|nr:TRAP transporter small permease subunit [Deltaproteobacteria bacterium]MBW2138597.1 TRAP transporter small permease subunit [Deltaproteobacteria bacterium]